MHLLLATFEAGGNIPFEMTLAHALTSAGHEVSVLGNNSLSDRARAAGARLVPYSNLADYDISVPRDVSELADTLINRFMFGEFVARDVANCCEDAAAEVILVDSLLYAALAGAEKTGKPIVSLWHTVMSDARAPYHREDTLRRLNSGRWSIGLHPVADFDQQLAVADLNLALTMEQFDAANASLPKNFSYAGPMVDWGPSDSSWRDDESTLVVVSFSTMHLSHQAAVIQKVLDALATLDVRILLTLGPGMRGEDLDISDRVTTRSFVPHSDVLPYAALLITHAGYGTVVAGTLSGTPRLCLPLTEEEGAVAEQVVLNGFGLRLSAQEASVREIRDGIKQLLAGRAFGERVSSFAKMLDPFQAKALAVERIQSLIGD